MVQKFYHYFLFTLSFLFSSQSFDCLQGEHWDNFEKATNEQIPDLPNVHLKVREHRKRILENTGSEFH